MIVAFIQARMGSVRLPNKVMKLVNEKPMIYYLLSRVAKAELVDKVVVATSTNSNNDPLVSFVKSIGFESFRGDEQDVLNRFYQAAKYYKATIVLRITADCPLVDPDLIDSLIKDFHNSGADYATNTLPSTYPDGLDVEVFSFSALEIAYEEAIAFNEREHVTPYIRYSGKFKIFNSRSPIDYSNRRWTVDEPEDFEVINNVFSYFHPDIYFSWKMIIDLENSQKTLFEKNKEIKRNQGAVLTNTEKYHKRAIRAGLFVGDETSDLAMLPVIHKVDNNRIFDIDGNSFVDFSENNLRMPLGYRYPSSLNNDRFVTNEYVSVEKIEVAEKFLILHPWATSMIFNSSVEESLNMITSFCKISRKSFSICSYNSATDQLLLRPYSSSLMSNEDFSTKYFSFSNDELSSVESYMVQKNLGFLMVDILSFPEEQFHLLHLLRKLTTKNNVVLTFDETKTANRANIGGAHLLIKCDPDICIFGPSIANGLPVSVLITNDKCKNVIASEHQSYQLIPNFIFSSILEFQNTDHLNASFWQSIVQRNKFIYSKLVEIKNLYNLPFDIHQLFGACRIEDTSSNRMWSQSFYKHMYKRNFFCNDIIALNANHNMEIIESYFFHLEEFLNNGKE